MNLYPKGLRPSIKRLPDNLNFLKPVFIIRIHLGFISYYLLSSHIKNICTEKLCSVNHVTLAVSWLPKAPGGLHLCWMLLATLPASRVHVLGGPIIIRCFSPATGQPLLIFLSPFFTPKCLTQSRDPTLSFPPFPVRECQKEVFKTFSDSYIF